MSLTIAVPFRDGGIVAASADVLHTGILPEDPARLYTTVVKTPWGLLAGGSAAVLDRVRRAVLESEVVTVRDVHRQLMRLLPPGDQAKLFSYEPEESLEHDPRVVTEFEEEGRPEAAKLGLPVRLYRVSAEGASWLSWGAVVSPQLLSAGDARDGELFLRLQLGNGSGFDDRLEAVMMTFSWFRERLPSLAAEVDVGIHEPGHRYSVDRVRW